MEFAKVASCGPGSNSLGAELLEASDPVSESSDVDPIRRLDVGGVVGGKGGHHRVQSGELLWGVRRPPLHANRHSNQDQDLLGIQVPIMEEPNRPPPWLEALSAIAA